MPSRLTRLALLATAGALIAPGTAAASVGAKARAAGFAVQVIVPSGSTTVRGGVELSTGTSAASGAWAYEGDASLVSVGSYAVRGQARRAPTAAAETTLTGVSAVGGVVRASSVTLAATASAPGSVPTDQLSVSVRGLEVAGKAVAATANHVVRVPDVGTLTVDEQVESRSAMARRGFVTALHLRLAYPYHGLPTGTEVLIGFADAGVSVPKAAAGRASGQSGGALTSSAGRAVAVNGSVPPKASAAPTTPPPAGLATSAGGHISIAEAESPPSGGFTRTPPIAAADRSRLLAPGAFRFPVVGGASFSDDFGGPRADTGFHQGIDLFAPVGTPVVAIHDGTLFNVGWNRLGGNRLWLDDGVGDAFYYAHLSAYAPIAIEGAAVKAGDVIGFVGATGDAVGTPSHLHFEIHPNGHWAVPPIAYVSAWKAQGTTLAPADGSASPLAVTRTGASVFAPSPLDEGTGPVDISSISGLDLAGIVAVGTTPGPTGQAESAPPSPLGSPSASSGLGFGSLD